jgi:REP element-mobilizing transposase RayT
MDKTPEIRPDMHLQLGEFVVMPNHIHGIVMIGENEFNSDGCGDDGWDGDGGRDAMHGVSTDAPIIPSPESTPFKPYKNKFAPQSKNLASIMRGYKSAVTTWARKNNIDFGWQARFHDHIIRNHQEFLRISNYIRMNPLNWKDDRFWG